MKLKSNRPKEARSNMDNDANTNKKVFISYSWSVQERVIELAERLLANGIEVILDVYDLKDGHDKYVFMEQAVSDPTVDHVLIVCDKAYTEKANSRSGGVGDETAIITPEIYNSAKQEKFIPIIFEKDEDGKPYCPVYIKSRIYIDLSSENLYESEYEKLLRDIYQKPLFRKPALGQKPEWLENDAVDLSPIRDVIKQVKGFSGNDSIKADFLLRKVTDEFRIAVKQYMLPGEKPAEEEILPAIDRTKNFRDLFIDYCEALIYSNFPLPNTLIGFFECLYNDLHDATGPHAYNEKDFELADFIIWELFISSTAILLHYERYKDLHDLLIRPYFLRNSPMGSDVDVYGYWNFRAYSHMIEDTCKKRSENPRLFTMSGNILVSREKKPILTQKTISNADIVLYQLGTILETPPDEHFCKYWFPTTYVYHKGKQVIWQKLRSETYCKKIAPLFGTTTVEGIKAIVKNSIPDREMKHPGAWDSAPGILSSITLEEIGTLK